MMCRQSPAGVGAAFRPRSDPGHHRRGRETVVDARPGPCQLSGGASFQAAGGGAGSGGGGGWAAGRGAGWRTGGAQGASSGSRDEVGWHRASDGTQAGRARRLWSPDLLGLRRAGGL